MQPGMLRCSKCDKEATGYCMCCKTVRYCGRECQRADWAAHELVCKDAECKKDEPVPAAAECTGARPRSGRGHRREMPAELKRTVHVDL